MPSLDHSEPTVLDRTFDAFSHPLRRQILNQVYDRIPRDDADLLAGSRTGDAADPDPTAVELYHCHLPKLAEAGFLDWDPDANAVRRGPRFDEIAPLIELLVDHGDEPPAEWP